jgi:hypothetical protein
MNHNVDALLQEAFNMNLVIQMWLKLQSFPLLILELNEYMKVIEIVMVEVLGSMEDERTFKNLAFMKSKLHN